MAGIGTTLTVLELSERALIRMGASASDGYGLCYEFSVSNTSKKRGFDLHMFTRDT